MSADFNMKDTPYSNRQILFPYFHPKMWDYF